MCSHVSLLAQMSEIPCLLTAMIGVKVSYSQLATISEAKKSETIGLEPPTTQSQERGSATLGRSHWRLKKIPDS